MNTISPSFTMNATTPTGRPRCGSADYNSEHPSRIAKTCKDGLRVGHSPCEAYHMVAGTKGKTCRYLQER